jgi:hypothetical protein
VRRLALLLLLSGCTTSVRHLSDPSVAEDGFNLVCAGIEQDDYVFTMALDVCHNVSGIRGEYVFAEVKYHWRKR